jgi:hypothetical protein
MRTNTNLKNSHTVYPDGLRVEYDYCKCDKKVDVFGILIIALNLLWCGVLIYLSF